MQADQLFLRTLGDLDRRTTVTDEYEALLAAGLLRKLLLDKAPLVHQVNRYRRERIRFHINGETPLERTILEDNPAFWAIGDAIDPSVFPSPGISAPMDAKLDQFLARKAMSDAAHGGVPFTVVPSARACAPSYWHRAASSSRPSSCRCPRQVTNA